MVVVEAEVDESTQVDGGDPDVETGLVAGEAVVADSAVAVGDEPGDGAFDHGPPDSHKIAIGLDQYICQGR